MSNVLHNSLCLYLVVIPIASNRAKLDIMFFNELGQDTPDLILIPFTQMTAAGKPISQVLHGILFMLFLVHLSHLDSRWDYPDQLGLRL